MCHYKTESFWIANQSRVIHDFWWCANSNRDYQDCEKRYQKSNDRARAKVNRPTWKVNHPTWKQATLFPNCHCSLTDGTNLSYTSATYSHARFITLCCCMSDEMQNIAVHVWLTPRTSVALIVRNCMHRCVDISVGCKVTC